jgi:hypothetical protein
MGKAKSERKSKARNSKGQSRKKAPKIRASRPAGKAPMPIAAAMKGLKKKSVKKRAVVAPVDDADIERVAGIPSEAQIEEAAGPLSPSDRDAFHKARRMLAEHLTSHAAARLWLVTPSAGFVTTPLDAIRNGQAKLVLAMLESQWGPSPTYA